MEQLFVASKDKDPAVFKCSLAEDCDLENWELLDDQLFVDHSGFGANDEPALTADQFLEKVKEGFGYAIVEQGQFQLYVGVYKRKD
ncbi:MAG TPA: hypothetical protein ENH82_13700 [bacterium]|nr:hypothetical protein [bacterium]